MAPEIVLDIVEGATSGHDLMAGWTITRVCIVTGLNPTGALSDPQLKAAAEAMVIGVTGDRGSSCPGVSAPTFLQRFDTDIIGSDCVKVRVTYKGYPLPVYEFDSSLNMVESNLDNNGKPIVLQYTIPTGYPFEQGQTNFAPGKVVPQGGLIRRPVGEALFIVRFIIAPGIEIPQPSSGTLAMQQMTWLKQKYEGVANNVTYSVGVLAGPPRCWLIEKVSGISRDGMLTYEATMMLHYRPVPPTPDAGWGGMSPGGWDQPATFIDPHTGQPPTDITTGALASSPPSPLWGATSQTEPGATLVPWPITGDFPQLPGTTGGVAVPTSPLNFWGN